MAYKTASRAYCMAKTQLSVLRELYNWELRRTVDPEGNETNDSLGIIQLYQSTEDVFGRPCLKTSYGLYVIGVLDFVFDGLDAVVYDNDANDMGTVYWKIIPIGQLATREFAEKNNYTLTSPSNEYDSNRIIREVDVLKKEKISVYYLSSLFTVKGEDNRVETPSSINLEVVPNWLDTALGHFDDTRTGSISTLRQWCNRMIKSIPGGRFKVTINNDLPVYIYRLAVVTLDGSYISSWDLNDSQSGSFSFTANADCIVIMDWYYPYSIKSEYTMHTNSLGPTPYDWVVEYGANDVPTYSKTWCDIDDVDTADEFPVWDALNTYADFLKGTVYSGDNYPKGEMPPALLSRNTRCKLSLSMLRDGKSTRPVVENVRIYDPGSWELLEVLNESNYTDYYDNKYIWEYTMTRPILVSSSVSSSAGVSRTVDVTIDYTPTVSITDIQGNVGDITQVDANTIKLLVKSYSTLKIQYTSLFVSRVSMSDSGRSNLYMPGTVLWTERFIHAAHGGKNNSYYVSIISDVPACIFSGLDSVDIPYNTTFSGGDNPTVVSVKRYGDINKGYVHTKFNDLININYTNIPYQFSLNVSVRELSFYSDAESSSSFNIPNYIFSGCDALKTFDLNLNNNPPVYFGSYAFYLCPSLKNVDIPNNTKSFGEGCFMYSGIESFTCPPDITAIADKLALSCRNLSTVKLTEATGLLSIGKRAFSSSWTTNSKIDSVFSSLKTVTVPQSVKAIKDYAFSGNYLLDGITTNPMSDMISGSNMFIFNVDSSFKNNMNTIEEGVFSYCAGLTSISLPSSVYLINTLAFLGCDKIVSFKSPGLYILYNDVFKDTWVHDYFADSSLEDTGLNWPSTQLLMRRPGTEGILYYKMTAGSNDYECTIIQPDPDISEFILYRRRGRAGSSVFDPSFDLRSISPYGYARDDSTLFDLGEYLVDLSRLSKLKYIGHHAFAGTAISEISLSGSGSTTYLGASAFKNCKRLQNVVNFKKLLITKIEDYTFYNCGTNRWGLGSDANENLVSDFYLPDTLTEIGNYAFANCPQLMRIENLATCPIHTIGKYAFQNCFNNTAWRLRYAGFITGAVAAAIGIAACFLFGGHSLGCSIVGSAVPWAATIAAESAWIIAEGVIGGICVVGSVGAAYHTTTDLKEHYLTVTEKHDLRWMATLHTSNLLMPKLRNIGEGAFKDCAYLGGLVLSSLTTSIPDYAFLNCKRFSSILFLEDSYDINGTKAYNTVPGYNLTSIGRQAFKGCDKIELISILGLLSAELQTIKEGAFDGVEIYKNEDNLGLALSGSIKSIGAGALDFKEMVPIIWATLDPSSIQLGANAFGAYSKKLLFKVPKGSKSKFQTLLSKYTNATVEEIELTDVTWEYLKLMLGFPITWVNE